MRDPDLPEGVSLAAYGAEIGGEAETVDDLFEGRPYRVLAVGVEATLHNFGRRRSRESEPAAEPAPPEKHAIVVYMASDVSDMQAELARLSWILAAVWAGATALSFVVSLGLSRTVLHPVDSVSRTIAELSPTNLAARVPMESVPTELDTVVTRLNELLARVEGQFQRERATIANIAHELRNPLGALRTTLEFGLLQAPPTANKKTMESSLALALRMQSLVSGLLTLTRIEAGQEVLAREAVDLVTVLQDAWDTIEARASGRGLRVEWEVPDSLRIVTSPAHVSMIASNLFDNAVSHGTADSVVTVELAQSPGRVRWTVSNPCAHTPRSTDFFKAFWRSDPARAGGRHFGLGLALCDRIVRLLGGTIEAKLDGGTFAITLELPVEPAAVPDAPVAQGRREPAFEG
jgi:signal transduction histidine kinase